MKSHMKRVLSRLGLAGFAFRTREWLRGLNFRTHRAVAPPDGFPIPPGRLIVLVTGSSDRAWYVDGGRLGAQSIRETLEIAGLDVASFRTVLDFGCGCGRVIRHWRPLTEAELYGSDCNPKMVEWCRGNLPFAKFQLNTLEPTLEYTDQQFEFAYALSVLAHTPESLQQPWIDELWRILRPGGYLLITTQGGEYLSRLTPKEKIQYQEGRLVVRYQGAGGAIFAVLITRSDTCGSNWRGNSR
jgi:SAM-dependent methyltransferase